MTLTSNELSIDRHIYPLAEIHSVRALQRRKLAFWPLRPFALVITTSTGEWEVLRHRNAYVIHQLQRALDAALREGREGLARSA